jgi:hypothetical protein
LACAVQGKVLEMVAGSSGWGQGRTVSLLDQITESGKVNEAWAALIDKTRETALAHSETADVLQVS